MRILVSDYSGHPFQAQLSRSLARRGHQLLHVSSASFQTPKGKLEADSLDPPGFAAVGVRTKQPFAKNSFFRRRRQEIEVGRLIAAQIAAFRPDVVISSNAPLDTQKEIQRAARRAGAGFVFWVQDLYGEAILRILRKKFGPAGAAIGLFYRRLEARMLRRADRIVAIAPEFTPAIVRLAGIGAERIAVIENWAPLDEIDTHARDNDWAVANLPASRLRMVYSGTLGFKHNPELLVRLAREVEGDVVVFSEGPAARALKARAEADGLANLRVSGWLPFETLPKALAGADLLIVILEPDAGAFSVPSKVLTYMCVGRAILGSIPAENLAARLISENGAGLVVDPDDEGGFVEAAKRLAADRESRLQMGRSARAYAEHAFDIEKITNRFEETFGGIGGMGNVSTMASRDGR